VLPWIKYTLIRVVLFVALFTVLVLIGTQVILAAVIAAVAGLCISYIFFTRQRDAVALSLANRRRSPRTDADADHEDSAVDHES